MLLHNKGRAEQSQERVYGSQRLKYLSGSLKKNFAHSGLCHYSAVMVWLACPLSFLLHQHTPTQLQLPPFFIQSVRLSIHPSINPSIHGPWPSWCQLFQDLLTESIELLLLMIPIGRAALSSPSVADISVLSPFYRHGLKHNLLHSPTPTSVAGVIHWLPLQRLRCK